MQAIAEEHINDMVQFRTSQFGADAIYVPAEILVGRTFDWLIAHNEKYPTFHHIFGGSWNDETLEQMGLNWSPTFGYRSKYRYLGW